MTTATATDPQTFPIWERLVVAVVPIAVVIWLLNFAWFQYGLSGRASPSNSPIRKRA